MSQKAAAGSRVALIVDNPFRDLPGLVLVAWKLCQAGVTCYLVPLNLQQREVWSLEPEFVLLNYLRPNNEAFVRSLLDTGIRVGVLDTEGGIFSPLPAAASTANGTAQIQGQIMTALENYALTMPRDSQIRQRVTCYCAWTPVLAEYVSRAGWYRQEQITVTGTPRVDYYAPDWQEAARRMSVYADAYPAPLILINGSFPLANPRFQTPDQEIEMLVRGFSYERGYVTQWLENQQAALTGLAALTNHLARTFPDATFIYRPHPFEGADVYRTLLEPLPNLHLVKQGTMDGWLLRARAIIHWGSSTAIEAGLVGIPAFTPGWLPEPLHVPEVDAVSISCASQKTLTEQMAAVLQGRFNRPAAVSSNLQNIIQSTFYKVDGLAHQRVVEAILPVLQTKGANLRLDICREGYYGLNFTGNSGRRRAKRLLFRILGPSLYSMVRRVRTRRDPSELWDGSEKHFDAADVQKTVDAIESVVSAQHRKVSARPARGTEAYHFGDRRGRTVVVRAEPIAG